MCRFIDSYLWVWWNTVSRICRGTQRRCSARVYLLSWRNITLFRLGNMCMFLGHGVLVLCEQSDPWIVWWEE